MNNKDSLIKKYCFMKNIVPFRFWQVVVFRFSEVLTEFENHRLIWQRDRIKRLRAAAGRGLFEIFLLSELGWVKE